MTIIKYKTSKYYFREPIEVAECERETDVSVFVKGHRGHVRREAKMTDWHQYHDSWEAARAYLIEREEGKVIDAESALRDARAKVAEMRAIPEAQP